MASTHRPALTITARATPGLFKKEISKKYICIQMSRDKRKLRNTPVAKFVVEHLSNQEAVEFLEDPGTRGNRSSNLGIHKQTN